MLSIIAHIWLTNIFKIFLQDYIPFTFFIPVFLQPCIKQQAPKAGLVVIALITGRG